MAAMLGCWSTSTRDNEADEKQESLVLHGESGSLTTGLRPRTRNTIAAVCVVLLVTTWVMMAEIVQGTSLTSPPRRRHLPYWIHSHHPGLQKDYKKPFLLALLARAGYALLLLGWWLYSRWRRWRCPGLPPRALIGYVDAFQWMLTLLGHFLGSRTSSVARCSVLSRCSLVMFGT